mgnify:FL=1
MSKILTLGEIMLRLSTDPGTLMTYSTNFTGHYGGGEANVGISLANFGHEVAFASKVPANPLGVAVRKHLKSYGICTALLRKGGERLGTYYLESGEGARAASVVYDRAHSSFSSMEALEWDFDELFEDVNLFHISGVTAALTKEWAAWSVDLVREAKRRGIKVSFDINYRAKLWTQAECGAFLEQVLPLTDYLSAGKLDALYLMGIPENTSEQEDVTYYYEKMAEKYPNIEVFYSTIRQVHSASHNVLQGTMWRKGETTFSNVHTITPIVDRVGGGDAYAAGILHGILSGYTAEHTVDFAIAASSMKHTIHGDCNQFSAEEVEDFKNSESGAIKR